MKDLKGVYCGITIVGVTLHIAAVLLWQIPNSVRHLILGSIQRTPEVATTKQAAANVELNSTACVRVYREWKGHRKVAAESWRVASSYVGGGPQVCMRQRGEPLHSPASACLCFGVAPLSPGPTSCQKQYQAACQQDLFSSAWQVSGGRLLEQQWTIFGGGSNFVSVTKATAKREI